MAISCIFLLKLKNYRRSFWPNSSIWRKLWALILGGAPTYKTTSLPVCLFQTALIMLHLIVIGLRVSRETLGLKNVLSNMIQLTNHKKSVPKIRKSLRCENKGHFSCNYPTCCQQMSRLTHQLATCRMIIFVWKLRATFINLGLWMMQQFSLSFLEEV